jgi:hypothetical protein
VEEGIPRGIAEKMMLAVQNNKNEEAARLYQKI